MVIRRVYVLVAVLAAIVATYAVVEDPTGLATRHIARTFDFLSDGARAAMAMEYVDGMSLAELRADEPQRILKPEELEMWLAQICDALDYAHTKAGVVHRELDPRKILIDRSGDVKLIGFGPVQKPQLVINTVSFFCEGYLP